MEVHWAWVCPSKVGTYVSRGKKAQQHIHEPLQKNSENFILGNLSNMGQCTCGGAFGATGYGNNKDAGKQ